MQDLIFIAGFSAVLTAGLFIVCGIRLRAECRRRQNQKRH